MYRGGKYNFDMVRNDMSNVVKMNLKRKVTKTVANLVDVVERTVTVRTISWMDVG